MINLRVLEAWRLTAIDTDLKPSLTSIYTLCDHLDISLPSPRAFFFVPWMADSVWTTPMGSLALWVPVRFPERGAPAGHGTERRARLGYGLSWLFSGIAVGWLRCSVSLALSFRVLVTTLPSHSQAVVLTCPLLLAPG